MAFIEDTILDNMLAVVSAATHVAVCSGQPANYAGIAAVKLASGAVGSKTQDDDAGTGRKVAYGAVTGLAAESGLTDVTPTHVALHNNANTLYIVTTCSGSAISTGDTVDVGTFDHSLSQPVTP